MSSSGSGSPHDCRSGSAPGATPLPTPTTKPPTPPAIVRSAAAVNTGTPGRGTLDKYSCEYRTPPAVVPLQVPSHYVPNYPLPSRPAGYSTLPLQPQVGLVHPNQHQSPSNYTQQDLHSAPPSPLIGSDRERNQHSMVLLGHRALSSSASGSACGVSVALPQPPPPLDDELHDAFGARHMQL